MKWKALTLLIVTSLNMAVGIDEGDFDPCEDKPPMCVDCNTLGVCKETWDDENKIISFTYANGKSCVSSVCDQYYADCKEEGYCRYKAFECPKNNDCPTEAIYPDPYLCLDYHGCENGEHYKYTCLNGKAFDPEMLTCSLELNDTLCYDYLVRCEEEGQVMLVGRYKFTCVLEDDKLLYPEVTPICEINSTSTTNPEETSTHYSQVATDTTTIMTDASSISSDASEISTVATETSTSTLEDLTDAPEISTEMPIDF